MFAVLCTSLSESIQYSTSIFTFQQYNSKLCCIMIKKQKHATILSLLAIWTLLPELVWAQYPGIVNSQPVSKLSLEQMLIGLRSSPPHTASEFLASIVSHYGVPIFRQLTPSGPDSTDSYQLPSQQLDTQDTHLSSTEQPSLVFRQYDQQQVDTNRKIAVWIPGNPASSLQTTSKLPHSRSRVQFSMQDIAESANCEPEIQTVKLEHLVRLSLENVSQSTHSHNELVQLKGPSSSSSSSSVSDLYFPHCIRLSKCGGCCPSERLKCTPIDTQKQIISIMHVRYSAHDRRFQFCGLRRLTVERHTKCACQCRQKLEDCLPSQRYLPDECRCVCRPFGQALADCQAKQFRAGVLRPFINWNSVRCRCECRPPGGVWRCSSGHRFNYATCRCEIEPTAKRIRQLELHRPVPTSPASSVSSSTTRWPTSSVPTN